MLADAVADFAAAWLRFLPALVFGGEGNCLLAAEPCADLAGAASACPLLLRNTRAVGAAGGAAGLASCSKLWASAPAVQGVMASLHYVWHYESAMMLATCLRSFFAEASLK